MANICYGCFRTVEQTGVCPYCGYNADDVNRSPHILRPGTLLNGKHTVGKVIGEGGFGITYLAWDNNMKTKVAIKEFYPANLVKRDTTNSENTKVYTISESFDAEFHNGLERFVKEASVLAKFFDLQGIVSVKDFFYENGTAYIVMEYIEGITLKQYIKQSGGKLSGAETLELMRPVIESLAVVHNNKLLHRDISPDNLMITKQSQVKLIDFGSARYFDTQTDKSMTVVLKHGYAPFEQYSSSGHQGAWTDIYSLCATMYRMITGTIPPESVNRIRTDECKPIRSMVKKVPKHVAAAIEKGLSVMPENRQQSLEELYHDLYISKRDLRKERSDAMFGSLNQLLIKLIAFITVILILAGVAMLNKERILPYVDKLKNQGGAAVEERYQSAGKELSKAADEEVIKENNEEDRASNAEKETEEDNLLQAASSQETSSYEIDEASVQEGESDYLKMRQAAQSASQIDSNVVIVKDGRLNNVADYTVGQILESYSDTEGSWYTYTDAATAQTYVYYKGMKGNSSFTFEFLVYANNTFKLTGAMQDDVSVDRYADFFQSVLDSLGL